MKNESIDSLLYNIKYSDSRRGYEKIQASYEELKKRAEGNNISAVRALGKLHYDHCTNESLRKNHSYFLSFRLSECERYWQYGADVLKDHPCRKDLANLYLENKQSPQNHIKGISLLLQNIEEGNEEAFNTLMKYLKNSTYFSLFLESLINQPNQAKIVENIKEYCKKRKQDETFPIPFEFLFSLLEKEEKEEFRPWHAVLNGKLIKPVIEGELEDQKQEVKNIKREEQLKFFLENKENFSFLLGIGYLFGSFPSGKDYIQAVSYLKETAVKGKDLEKAISNYYLYLCFYHGLGSQKSLDTALKHLNDFHDIALKNNNQILQNLYKKEFLSLVEKSEFLGQHLSLKNLKSLMEDKQCSASARQARQILAESGQNEESALAAIQIAYDAIAKPTEGVSDYKMASVYYQIAALKKEATLSTRVFSALQYKKYSPEQFLEGEREGEQKNPVSDFLFFFTASTIPLKDRSEYEMLLNSLNLPATWSIESNSVKFERSPENDVCISMRLVIFSQKNLNSLEKSILFEKLMKKINLTIPKEKILPKLAKSLLLDIVSKDETLPKDNMEALKENYKKLIKLINFSSSEQLQISQFLGDNCLLQDQTIKEIKEALESYTLKPSLSSEHEFKFLIGEHPDGVPGGFYASFISSDKDSLNIRLQRQGEVASRKTSNLSVKDIALSALFKLGHPRPKEIQKLACDDKGILCKLHYAEILLQKGYFHSTSSERSPLEWIYLAKVHLAQANDILKDNLNDFLNSKLGTILHTYTFPSKHSHADTRAVLSWLFKGLLINSQAISKFTLPELKNKNVMAKKLLSMWNDIFSKLPEENKLEFLIRVQVMNNKYHFNNPEINHLLSGLSPSPGEIKDRCIASTQGEEPDSQPPSPPPAFNPEHIAPPGAVPLPAYNPGYLAQQPNLSEAKPKELAITEQKNSTPVTSVKAPHQGLEQPEEQPGLFEQPGEGEAEQPGSSEQKGDPKLPALPSQPIPEPVIDGVPPKPAKIADQKSDQGEISKNSSAFLVNAHLAKNSQRKKKKEPALVLA